MLLADDNAVNRMFVSALLEQRGYEVAILHTGRHETDLIGPDIEHIHTDPFDVTVTWPTVDDPSTCTTLPIAR